MDFDNVVVKDSPGLCRCCLSEGCYKDLSTEYNWMGELEIYANMLIECFDLTIAEHQGGPNGLSRLICEVCITRLRDACNFKKQVMESEQRFGEQVNLGQYSSKVLVYPLRMEAVKREHVIEEEAEGEIEYLDEEIGFGEEEANADGAQQTQSIQLADGSSGQIVTLSAIPMVNLSGPLTPVTTMQMVTTKMPVKRQRKPTTSEVKIKVPRTTRVAKKGRKALKKASAETKPKKSVMSATRRNRLMKKNAIAVLESSTVCPFKWHRQNYLCFFCHRAFKCPDTLKSHTKADHAKSSVRAAVTYLRRDEMVKIDVTTIGCRLCDAPIDTLDALKGHLKATHKKVFLETYGDGLVPYRLQSDAFQCALCGETFQYFIKLNQHMNKHYGNYICEACGKSFLSQDRLRCHALSHGASFRCTECPEVFDSLTQKNNHSSEVHKKDKTLKCFYCAEAFPNYSQRKKHHRLAHNEEMPEFKCAVCGKVFQIMSKMQVHVKEVHMREKNYSCNVCEQKFFSKNHVQKHMIKHYGERIHQCEVCKKSYARKQTLRDHMRIHNNDRRFVCALCSQGFVQNNSLKLHMRVHHPDVTTA